jgi:hypothetical protein
MGLRGKRALQARHRALRSALKTFQFIPEFADVQVQIADLTKQTRESMAADTPNHGSDARMQHLVEIFDVCAREYLRLVRDLKTQKAYEIILAEYFCGAWEDFTGFGFESVRPSGNKSEPLMARVQYWTMEGYRKIALLSRKLERPLEDSTQTEQPECSLAERLAADRKARIMPILQSEGISASRWAKLAGVDPSVVYSYFAGKSMPRPANKKALADSIGVKISDFPD